MTLCSIIIRAYNEEEHIGRLLSGILQQTIQDIEIILVDSGSTDATVAIASRYPIKLVTIKPEAFSFGRSLNLGCQAATGQYLVIASAHVYPVYQDWLQQLLTPFCKPDIALVYGKQRGMETTQYSEHQIFAQWFPEQANYQQNHPFCNNANAAIRRQLWKQFPYDESLTGLEDLAWAKQVMAAGYTIAYVAGAEIIHIHQEKPSQTYNRYRREAMAFKKIFPHEQFRLREFLRLLSGNVLSDYYHAWQDKVLMRNWLSIPRFRLMQFWGTYQGFAHGAVSSQLQQTFYYPRQRQVLASNQKTTINRPMVDYQHYG